MTWVALTLGDTRFSARLLAERAPESAKLLRDSLPLTVRLVQDEWSGAMLRSAEPVFTATRCSDRLSAYQYPGLLFLEPGSGQLGLCYGQARLQSGTTVLPCVPLAEIRCDHEPLVQVCTPVQFQGATELRIEPGQGPFPVADEPPSGTTIAVELGSTRVTARVLEELCPQLATQFLSALPLDGLATNTHSSGPLTRFWNRDGGPEGETPLEPSAAERQHAQAVLYPGHLYYQPERPWRGLRIATSEATMMRSAVTGGALRLFPLARIEGSRTAFDDEAGSLIVDGAKPLHIARVPVRGSAAGDALADSPK